MRFITVRRCGPAGQEGTGLPQPDGRARIGWAGRLRLPIADAAGG